MRAKKRWAATIGRRHWLLASAAGAALASGAWWLRSEQSKEPSSNAQALQAFWDLHLQGLDRQTWGMQGFRGQPLLVNFWATWCAPCVQEMPLLSKFSHAQADRGTQGVRVLGIAVDRLEAVEKWLARQPVHFPVVLAGVEGMGLSRSLGNINGGLPFTLLFDAQGRIQQRKIGQITEKELIQWASLSQ